MAEGDMFCSVCNADDPPHAPGCALVSGDIARRAVEHAGGNWFDLPRPERTRLSRFTAQLIAYQAAHPMCSKQHRED